MTEMPDDLTHYMQKCSELKAALEQAEQRIASWTREASLNEQELIAHRIASAILVGTLVSDNPEALQWAEAGAGRQPEPTSSATRLIVRDVRLFDEGRAHELHAELNAALAAESPPVEAEEEG